MSFSLIQAGSALQSVNVDGSLSAALTLPSGVSLATNLVPRFCRFTQGTTTYVIVANTPSVPITVDPSGIVRVLTPNAPTTAVALSAGASGSLSGTYLAEQTYVIRDISGNIIAESDFGPLMSSAVTIASKKLTATFAVSPQSSVNATRLYRTATGPGSQYFLWTTVGGNTSTTYSGDESDSLIGTVSAPLLGSAPDLTLVCEWGGRIWGVDRTHIDDLRYTEAGTMYAWYSLNSIPIAPVGSDSAGITALIPRRNSLGVARKNSFSTINGTSRSNFTQTQYGQELGCLSQESVVIYKDTAYFLWRDGVYQWDNNGFTNLADSKVRTWFTSGDYFNPAMYWRSFATLDPVSLTYRLFLASAGSSVIDRWIEFDFSTGAWFGPHRTDAFTPTSAFLVYGADQQPYHVIGSSTGYLSLDQESRNDWTVYPISMSAITKQHTAGEPDYEKYWGQLSVKGKVESGGTVTITPTVGETEGATAGQVQRWDLTKGRQRLGRLGVGKTMKLEFDNAELNRDVVLEGYEVSPITLVGHR